MGRVNHYEIQNKPVTSDLALLQGLTPFLALSRVFAIRRRCAMLMTN
jgi:hypothetical protein